MGTRDARSVACPHCLAAPDRRCFDESRRVEHDGIHMDRIAKWQKSERERDVPVTSVRQMFESLNGHARPAELELIDEGGHARLRIREYDKASIWLTRDELTWLAEAALLLRAEMDARHGH